MKKEHYITEPGFLEAAGYLGQEDQGRTCGARGSPATRPPPLLPGLPVPPARVVLGGAPGQGKARNGAGPWQAAGGSVDEWVQAREGGNSGLGVQPDSPRARGRSLPSAFSQDPLLPYASSPIPEGISNQR